MPPEPAGLAILICSPSVEQPALCVTPLIHAMAARALDCEVEIHFAGPAVRFLVEGVAETLFPTPSHEKTVRAFLQEAHASGARLLACSMARATWVAESEGLIPECSGAVGATAFVVRTLEPDWKTLVF